MAIELTVELAERVFSEHLDEPVGGRIGDKSTVCPLEYVLRETIDPTATVGFTWACIHEKEIRLSPELQKFVHLVDRRSDRLKNPNGSWSGITGRIALEVLAEAKKGA